MLCFCCGIVTEKGEVKVSDVNFYYCPVHDCICIRIPTRDVAIRFQPLSAFWEFLLQINLFGAKARALSDTFHQAKARAAIETISDIECFLGMRSKDG